MPILTLQSGNVTVIAPPGRILQQVATDIMAGITGEVAKPVVLYVGSHALEREDREGLAIGIQTEQMFDETGKQLWSYFKPRRIHKIVEKYDVVLDLSHSNAPAYNELSEDARHKLCFGPHIFPDFVPDFVAGDELPLFYGTPKERRKQILKPLAARGQVSMLRRGTFGDELAQAVASSCAVVNVHIDEGIYTEYPRLLNAYLNGKIVMSEQLSRPLVAGRDYAELLAPLEPAQASEIYRNFSNFAQQHRMVDFLADKLS